VVRRLPLLDRQPKDQSFNSSTHTRCTTTSPLSLQPETEILNVQYDGTHDNLLVSLDDGQPARAYDMIWLATGFDIQIDNYPFLDEMRKELPVDVVEGLPMLNHKLSWRCSSAASGFESVCKTAARRRFWTMGPLAGLELGPDALNLMGARQGAVRVANAVRADIFAAATVGRRCSFSR
jgi:hypothetical protein